MIDVADPPTDERLYRDVAPELIRFATALVGRAEAADVMSNAFAEVMASRSWPTVVNRRAYLYRAVHNEARAHTKRSMLRAQRERRAANDDRWELPGLHPDMRAAVLRLSLRQRAATLRGRCHPDPAWRGGGHRWFAPGHAVARRRRMGARSTPPNRLNPSDRLRSA